MALFRHSSVLDLILQEEFQDGYLEAIKKKNLRNASEFA